MVVQRCDDHLRIHRIYRQINCASSLTFIQDTFPCLATISGSIYAAIRVGTEHITHGSYVHDIGIGWMNAEPGNVAGLLQAYVGPRLASIGGLVYPVSGRDELSLKPFPSSRVDHPGMRKRHVKGADGREFEESVRNVLPIYSGIGGLPHSAVGSSEIVDERIVDNSGYRDDTRSAVWSHEPPLECRKKAVIDTGIFDRLHGVNRFHGTTGQEYKEQRYRSPYNPGIRIIIHDIPFIGPTGDRAPYVNSNRPPRQRNQLRGFPDSEPLWYKHDPAPPANSHPLEAIGQRYEILHALHSAIRVGPCPDPEGKLFLRSEDLN